MPVTQSRFIFRSISLSSVILIGLSSSLVSAAITKDCRSRPGGGENICTLASISGATEEGLMFSEQASCVEVRQQRPYRRVNIPHNSLPNDSRLMDQNFLTELAWVTQQVRATGCVCCHDASSNFASTAWDVSQDSIWTDQLTTRGLGILSGRVSSTAFGGFSPEENNGFDRSQTGVPTTEIARLKAFFDVEIKRRGIPDEVFEKIKPLGGGSR
ncbi:MAG: hypothetical protein NTX25_21495 [Proteobacteria bacterium]|nr:hypothetical protein [Pseudomonadota bacterium]